MNKRSMYTIALAVLLLGVVTVTSGVWFAGSFSHGEPDFDQGCYCHNNNIQVWINGTGDGEGGVYLGSIAAGSTFHIVATTTNLMASGVVPGLQEWESNQTDNAKFTFSPQSATITSPQNINKTSGAMTVLYKVTAPPTSGLYILTLYGQGAILQPVEVQVTGTATSTSTTTTTTTTPTTTSTTTTSTSTTTTKSTTTTTTPTTSTTTTTTTPTTSTTTTTTASTTSTTHSTTSTTTTASTKGSITFTSPTSGASLVGSQSYAISGTITPPPTLPDNVFIDVELQGSSTVLDSSLQAVTASGTFSYTTSAGGSPSWVTGTYVITAIDSNGATGTTTFKYTASSTTTTTTTSTPTTTTTSASSTKSTTTTATTLTGPTTVTQTVTTTVSAPTMTATVTNTQTITGAASTVTNTQTNTQTITGAASTVTSTATTTAPPTTLTNTQTTTLTSTSTATTSAVPGWAYGLMVALLLIGLAIGYVVRRSSTKQS